MEWTQFAIFLVTMIGFFMAHRADMNMMLQLIRGIDKEMKDFHGRLCAIEERNKGK